MMDESIGITSALGNGSPGPVAGGASPRAGATRRVITNAASTGVRIDRKRLKALTRRSNAPGLIYLAVWALAMFLAGSLVWLTLGTVWVWPSVFVYGVVLTVPTYSLSHETAHGTAFRARWLNETVFWLASLLYGEEPLHRRYTHTNHHTCTWHVGLDSQMPFDTPLDFKGWLYDVSGLSILHRFQLRVLWQLSTKRYTKLMRDVAPAAELPKMTRNARIFSLAYLGVAGLIAAGFTWPLWFYVLPRLIGGPIMLMFNIIQHAEMQENSPSIIESTRTFRTELRIGRFLYLEHEQPRGTPPLPAGAVLLPPRAAQGGGRPDPGSGPGLLANQPRSALGRGPAVARPEYQGRPDPAGPAHGDGRHLHSDREGDDAVKLKRIYTYGGKPGPAQPDGGGPRRAQRQDEALSDLPGERRRRPRPARRRGSMC